MNQLKDIKPIVAIADNSLIYFLIALIIIAIALAFLYWKLGKKRHDSNKKIALKKLQALDFSNSKAVAYDFKKYAQLLCNETNQAKFKQINSDLESYKYKKQVGDLNPALIQTIQDFIRV
ncbi:hypothetical protein [Candidatus Thioglobus autotrophicus]|uniref:hypothetical protein n=1 Tax=Candidatus Thioglobus autotrophicus TaxID=1705394 RepID=UPI00299EFA75|nr:hypothetical protein [Candidatus Thioglobus autotrophicus]WPE17292.1 hypothetical protein R5P05_04230 [Candidatus Thioglobus autotrophicus]